MKEVTGYTMVDDICFGSSKGYAQVGQRDGNELDASRVAPITEELKKGRGNFPKAMRNFSEGGATHYAIYRNGYRGSKQYQTYHYVAFVAAKQA